MDQPVTVSSDGDLSFERWGFIMWAILNDLYREYCLARVTEMRKVELTH